MNDEELGEELRRCNEYAIQYWRAMDMIHAVHKLGYNEAPDLVAVLLQTLLFKQGGQISLSIREINQVQIDYPEIRLALSTGADDPADDRHVGRHVAEQGVEVGLDPADHADIAAHVRQ